MNFDDISTIKNIDQSNYLQEIINLDEKILSGWEFVLKQDAFLESKIGLIRFWGFEEFQTEKEIIRELISPHLQISLIKNESNFITTNEIDDQSLVICLVNQKNMEGFHKILKTSKASRVNLFILEVGNKTKFEPSLKVVGHWNLSEQSFSRTWIGYDLMILYGALFKCGLVPDITEEVRNIKSEVSNSLKYIGVSTPSSQNPAKRLAGQMVGRWIKIIGGGITDAIARRWSEQINKSAKQLSFAENINQLCFHSLSGIFFPENIIPQSLVVFLKSSLNDEYTESLLDKGKEELMCNGVGTDFYIIRGETRFSQIVGAILFGDFVAYYLAIANQCDPSPIASIEIE